MGWNHPYIFWGIAKTIHERPGASILEKNGNEKRQKMKNKKRPYGGNEAVHTFFFQSCLPQILDYFVPNG